MSRLSKVSNTAVLLAAVLTTGTLLLSQPATAWEWREHYDRNRTKLVDRLPMSLQLTLRGYAVQSPTRFLNAFESMVYYNQDLGPLLAEEARYYRPDLTPQIDEIMLQIFPPPTLEDDATRRVLQATPYRLAPAEERAPYAAAPYGAPYGGSVDAAKDGVSYR